uniref:Peptidase S8/S53 domain-containing protein n=1 Tax=Panagrolaimus sp. ES5 TaxID=591445 RepID=A0AC34FTY3_9BILA
MKEMCKQIYGYEETDVPKIFQFSSKGPLKTGERGIDFVAPGAAITEIPKWISKNGYKISRGTSMACPNAAGAIACLLSALKANSIEYNPTMLRLALSNTAYLPENGDKLAFGAGIIQIYAAFEYIKTFKNIILSPKIPPIISIYESTKKATLMKAIYLIQNENDSISRKYCVKLNSTKTASWNLKLVPKSAETFIEFSKTLSKNMFFVKIFTASLKSGSLNYAEIHGYDSSINPSIGPLFYLPITVKQKSSIDI